MDMRGSPTLALVVALAGLLSGAPAALAQSQPPASPAQTQSQPPPAPAQPTNNLDNIKAALSHPPALNLAGDQMRFTSRSTASSRFWSFVGSYDLKNGPVKHSTMTGQEFLDMMRPKELYSSAGITAPELLQFALTNIAAQALIRNAIRDIRNAKTEAEVREIRARIDRELQALKGGGG
jgi:glucose/arabinose dehydrogenase